MANMSFTNNAATTLASSITSVATSLTVASGTGTLFPALSGSQYFWCTLANNAGTVEIVKVTARSTDTFTITRAQDNTSAVSWSSGDKVELRLVAAALNDLPKLDEANTFASSVTQTIGTLALTNALTVANGGTGATTLTANNVLLGNGTSAPQVVAPGTSGNVLTSNGTTWASTAASSYGGPRAQFFNTPGASQTFLIPTGVTSVKVTLQAGGGGGGGPNNCNTSNGGAGGVGGAGVQWFTGLTPGNTLTVTVGAAGTAGGTAGNGGTGGSSSVASGTQTISTISATGGTGGQWSGGGGGTGSAGTASGFVNGTLLTGVAITGTAGQFSCSASSITLVTGQRLTISGTKGGGGSITGYTNPTSYYVIATNGSTTFTLSATYGGAAITTTAGTPTGLTYAIIDSGAAGFTLVAGTYWNPLNKGVPGTGAVPSGSGAGAGGVGAVLFEY